MAGDAVTAARRFAGVRPHLVVLDLLLPAATAWSSAGGSVAGRTARAWPCLILTARDAVADRIAGLDAGADDYLVKPVALEELLARARAQLRRVWRPAPEALAYGGVELDPAAQVARRAGRAIDLTTTERHLLELFLRHPQEVLSRPAIGQHLWGLDFEAESNIIDVYVRRLQRKLEAGGEAPLLHTVRGAGYALREAALRPLAPRPPRRRPAGDRVLPANRALLWDDPGTRRTVRPRRPVGCGVGAAGAVAAAARPRSGQPARDDRLVVEGILWVMHTGVRWRDLPERYGPWYTVSTASTSGWRPGGGTGCWRRSRRRAPPPGPRTGAPPRGGHDGPGAAAAAGAPRGACGPAHARAARPARETAQGAEHGAGAGEAGAERNRTTPDA